METRKTFSIFLFLFLEISCAFRKVQPTAVYKSYVENKDDLWVPSLHNKGYVSEGVIVKGVGDSLDQISEERESSEENEVTKEVTDDETAAETLPEEMTYSQLKLELYGERAKLDRYLKHVEGRSHSALVSRLLEVQKKYTVDQKLNMLRKNIAQQEYMKRHVGCSPKLSFINVRDVYNTYDLVYYPHTVVLHTCDDDSSCCELSTDTCVAEKKEEVELFFQVSGERHKRVNVIKPLLFINHTSCQCVDRQEYYSPRTQPEKSRNAKKVKVTSPPSASAEEKRMLSTRPNVSSLATMQTSTCQCPVGMHPRKTNNQCFCECHSPDCTRISLGRVQLSREDRQCIQQGVCSPPECKFGDYLPTVGRCPTQGET